MIPCRFCRTEQRAIEAHIIPEGFFRALRDDSGRPLELRTNTPGVPPKRAPIGVYDSTILCAVCDNRFSPWDQHAQDIMLRDFSESTAISHDDGSVLGWTIPIFDYKLLKLFFVSLLWRASVSTQKFYERVDPRPFNETMRRMILTEDPGDPETFSVTLGRFADPRYRAILDPHRERYSGTNFVRFYLGGFVALLKVDRRVTPDPFANLIVRPGNPIVVISRSRDGKDAQVMRDIARTSQHWKRDFQRNHPPRA
jgi:hypothetical protein